MKAHNNISIYGHRTGEWDSLFLINIRRLVIITLFAMSMMPEDDDMGVLTTVMEEEETDISKLDFSHVSKHPYLSKVFCWICTPPYI